jgi:hypothetical protein
MALNDINGESIYSLDDGSAVIKGARQALKKLEILGQ